MLKMNILLLVIILLQMCGMLLGMIEPGKHQVQHHVEDQYVKQRSQQGSVLRPLQTAQNQPNQPIPRLPHVEQLEQTHRQLMQTLMAEQQMLNERMQRQHQVEILMAQLQQQYANAQTTLPPLQLEARLQQELQHLHTFIPHQKQIIAGQQYDIAEQKKLIAKQQQLDYYKQQQQQLNHTKYVQQAPQPHHRAKNPKRSRNESHHSQKKNSSPKPNESHHSQKKRQRKMTVNSRPVKAQNTENTVAQTVHSPSSQPSIVHIQLRDPYTPLLQQKNLEEALLKHEKHIGHISEDAITITSTLGRGGYGVVKRAVWKNPNTGISRDVAVKIARKLYGSRIIHQIHELLFAKLVNQSASQNVVGFIGSYLSKITDENKIHLPVVVFELIKGIKTTHSFSYAKPDFDKFIEQLNFDTPQNRAQFKTNFLYTDYSLSYKTMLNEFVLKQFHKTSSIEWFLDLMKSGFESLDAFHSKQVCHYDVKPANMLLDVRTGKVRLTDYGTVCVQEPVPKTLINTFVNLYEEEYGPVKFGLSKESRRRVLHKIVKSNFSKRHDGWICDMYSTTYYHSLLVEFTAKQTNEYEIKKSDIDKRKRDILERYIDGQQLCAQADLYSMSTSFIDVLFGIPYWKQYPKVRNSFHTQVFKYPANNPTHAIKFNFDELAATNFVKFMNGIASDKTAFSDMLHSQLWSHFSLDEKQSIARVLSPMIMSQIKDNGEIVQSSMKVSSAKDIITIIEKEKKMYAIDLSQVTKSSTPEPLHIDEGLARFIDELTGEGEDESLGNVLIGKHHDAFFEEMNTFFNDDFAHQLNHSE